MYKKSRPLGNKLMKECADKVQVLSPCNHDNLLNSKSELLFEGLQMQSNLKAQNQQTMLTSGSQPNTYTYYLVVGYEEWQMQEKIDDGFWTGQIPEVLTKKSHKSISTQQYLILKVRDDNVAYFNEQFPKGAYIHLGYNIDQLRQTIKFGNEQLSGIICGKLAEQNLQCEVTGGGNLRIIDNSEVPCVYSYLLRNYFQDLLNVL